MILCAIALLSACSSVDTTPSAKAPSPASTTETATNEPKAGGYYLDDGPGEDAPADIDGIPDAQLKIEAPLERANKPYSALGLQYKPLTTYTTYKKQGMASWYGKRYHGKKTSSGEIYDMYSMTAAHTTLPIPSYARVTNPANGRSVVVRINDRGPFKHDRLVDLSYAAAYKLRLVDQGSALVELEMLDTSSNESIAKAAHQPTKKVETAATSTIESKPAAPAKAAPAAASAAVTTPVEIEPTVKAEPEIKIAPAPVVNVPQAKTPVVAVPAATTPAVANPAKGTTTLIKKANSGKLQYYVQAGAFKNEANSQALIKKIQGLTLAENVPLDSVYNDGLYRVKLGPYATRKAADEAANIIRKQLSIAAIVKN